MHYSIKSQGNYLLISHWAKNCKHKEKKKVVSFFNLLFADFIIMPFIEASSLLIRRHEMCQHHIQARGAIGENLEIGKELLFCADQHSL